MLLITHDLGVVAQTCDKVAIMYAGEIIEHGTAEDIFNGTQRHPYTDGLFGSIPDLTVRTRRPFPDRRAHAGPDRPAGRLQFHDRCPHCMDICRKEAPPKNAHGKPSYPLPSHSAAEQRRGSTMNTPFN